MDQGSHASHRLALQGGGLKYHIHCTNTPLFCVIYIALTESQHWEENDLLRRSGVSGGFATLPVLTRAMQHFLLLVTVLHLLTLVSLRI